MDWLAKIALTVLVLWTILNIWIIVHIEPSYAPKWAVWSMAGMLYCAIAGFVGSLLWRIWTY